MAVKATSAVLDCVQAAAELGFISRGEVQWCEAIMDISFHCDKCDQHILIDEAAAGLNVQCPKCKC